METFISIIIPVFNREHLVSETLDSIIAQTYSNWECIIIDDKSTDDTIEVLRKYSTKDNRIQYFEKPISLDKGVNSARKYGFEKSKGNFICWFDSDDIMHPEKLERCSIELEERTNDLIIHNFNYFRLDDYCGEPYNNFSIIKDIKTDYFSGKFIVNFQSTMWRKEAINIEYLKSSLSYAEDVYFVGNHLIANHIRVSVIDEVLCSIRKHSNSLTTEFLDKPERLVKDEIYVRRYFWNNHRNHIHKKGVLKSYLKSLKYLLVIKENKTFFRYMSSIFVHSNLEYKFICFKLAILSIFYIFTKRGITLYQKTVNSL